MTKKLEELTYWELSPEEKLRWHVIHDCICGFLEYDEYNTPHGHYKGCPMNDSEDESWDYIYWYDNVPL